MRILIAEDDVVSNRMLESVLKKWGYVVLTTRDGAEAWQALRGDFTPPLMLLDLMMPKMDGLELCRKIRADPRHKLAYIIMLTALVGKKDIVAGLEAGANDYVTKPFSHEELRARLQVGKRVIELQSALNKRVDELQEALRHIKTLQGILPICMHCHKIRDDQDAWQRIDTYISQHSKAEFSHGICPECYDKYYPQFKKRPPNDKSEKPT